MILVDIMGMFGVDSLNVRCVKIFWIYKYFFEIVICYINMFIMLVKKMWRRKFGGFCSNFEWFVVDKECLMLLVGSI